MGKSFIFAFAFAYAGFWIACLMPGTVSLALKVQALVGSKDAAGTLSVIVGGGVLLPLVVMPVVGRLSDGTTARIGMRRPYLLVGAAGTRAALAGPAFDTTVITRAFTGRSARALRDHFTDRYSTLDPAGHPALHHLTGPLRKAATAAGDTSVIHLWAGTGFRQARTEPAYRTNERLAGPTLTGRPPRMPFIAS